MRGVLQVAGGVLLALVVVLIVIGVGSIRVPALPSSYPTATPLPDGTVTQRQMSALVAACGESWQSVQQNLDTGYAYAQNTASKDAAEQRMLGALMSVLSSSRPFAACEQLDCPACLASLATGTPAPLPASLPS